MNDQELQAQQRDVQRLPGRCLLRLQQYERLMKAVIAHYDLSGPAHTLEKIRAARLGDASTKTLWHPRAAVVRIVCRDSEDRRFI
jgi:hypothetical protein